MKIGTLLAAISLSVLGGVSMASAQTGAIEKVQRYYSDAFHTEQVGEVVFYCDGGVVTEGFISSDYTEEYFGCP